MAAGIEAKLTLKRLNVVKVVDSEAKAQALVAKGFTRVTQDDAKPPQNKKPPKGGEASQANAQGKPDGGNTSPDSNNPEGGK